jgi:hypothetical protein
MPRLSPEIPNAGNDDAMNVDNEEKVQGSEGEEEEDGSEYEIEEIMDAKRGAFPEVTCFHLFLPGARLKMTRLIRAVWATS